MSEKSLDEISGAVLIIKPHAMDKQSDIEQLLLSHDIRILVKEQ